MLLIVILVLVRVIFSSSDYIVGITFFINLISLLYICWSIKFQVEEKVIVPIAEPLEHKIMRRKNKKIERRLNVYIGIVIGIFFSAGGIVFLFYAKDGVGVYNDILGLIALGLSIEDGDICEIIATKVK